MYLPCYFIFNNIEIIYGFNDLEHARLSKYPGARIIMVSTEICFLFYCNGIFYVIGAAAYLHKCYSHSRMFF